jgi:two-component system, sensor histidine kinase and response regulator
MRRWIDLSLRDRLIATLVTAFGVLAAVLAWHLARDWKERVEVAQRQLMTDATLIAARQQLLAERADAVLNGLLLLPEVRSSDSDEACSRVLAERLQQEASFIQIARVRLDGTVQCAAKAAAKPPNLADRPYF